MDQVQLAIRGLQELMTIIGVHIETADGRRQSFYIDEDDRLVLSSERSTAFLVGKTTTAALQILTCVRGRPMYREAVPEGRRLVARVIDLAGVDESHPAHTPDTILHVGDKFDSEFGWVARGPDDDDGLVLVENEVEALSLRLAYFNK